MERCAVCETLVQAADAIHRCVSPCKKLFHASCIRDKLPVANDDVILLVESLVRVFDVCRDTQRDSFASSACEQMRFFPRVVFSAYSNENRSLSRANLHYDNLVNLLTDNARLVDNLI